MTVDLILAIGHHLAVFGLAAIITAELVLVRADLGERAIQRVARIDMLYGVFAVLIIVIGILRVFFGIKGAGYYLVSPSFWAKMAAFILLGLLSIRPTIRIGSWRRAAAATPDFSPPLGEVQSVRRMMQIEAAVFVLIPVFAAAMARGF